MTNPMDRALLYARTVAHLRPSQVLARAWRSAGGRTPLKLGYVPRPDVAKVDIPRVPALPELDFDPAFLARFDVDAICDDRLELLHHEERVDWDSCWHEPLSTPLWRFNLHYHEYLLPLAKAWVDTSDGRYLGKAKSVVDAWIEACPRERGGDAWHPYVISMRAVSWLAFRAELADVLAADTAFRARMDASLAEQYAHLSQHLETDLLANHYLEDLKALAILACYFHDDETLGLVLPRLKGQIAEQVLPDGMHFELSPMYHKIVLEDLLRVATVLRASGFKQDWARAYRLQDMCDVLWSLEAGCGRTPLFNDAGDNVAKSRDALLACARGRFGIEPVQKSLLPDAGYAILKRETTAGHIKLILDCGWPGPACAMGHAHCDALSVECFVDGRPWIVNRGTYSYQGESRLSYKSSAAHSSPVAQGHEQHECWSSFRVARYGTCELVHADATSAEVELTTFDGTRVRRCVQLAEEGVVLRDACDDGSCELATTLHFAHANLFPDEAVEPPVPYAPEFGLSVPCEMVRLACRGGQEVVVPYPSL